MLANCIISLAAQHAPEVGKGEVGKGTEPLTDRESVTISGAISGARFYILDGIRGDAPEAGFWSRLDSALPHGMKIADPRGTADLLGEISAELACATGTIGRTRAADLLDYL